MPDDPPALGLSFATKVLRSGRTDRHAAQVVRLSDCWRVHVPHAHIFDGKWLLRLLGDTEGWTCPTESRLGLL